MNFKDKHVFIIMDYDKFFYLQADALIHKVGINPTSLCAIVLNMPGQDEFNTLSKIDGVQYVKYNKGVVEDILGAKSITTISLLSYNSWLIKELIETDVNVLDKLYVFLTDDEVDRWRIEYKKHGIVKPNADMRISAACLKVLSKIKHMIALSAIFESEVNTILGREINFIDAGIIFDTMNNRDSNKFIDLLSNKYKKNNVILYGTKAFPRNWIVPFYKFVSSLKVNNVSFIIFTQDRLSILFLEVIRFLLFKFKKLNINISYLNQTDPLTYSSIVMSCSHIVLQDRGGASTAKYFAKLGNGIICVKDGSPNYRGLCDGHDLSVITFKTTKELATKIFSKSTDIDLNQKKLVNLEQVWIDRYRDLYK